MSVYQCKCGAIVSAAAPVQHTCGDADTAKARLFGIEVPQDFSFKGEQFAQQVSAGSPLTMDMILRARDRLTDRAAGVGIDSVSGDTITITPRAVWVDDWSNPPKFDPAADAYEMRFTTYADIRPQLRNVLPALMLDDPDPYAAGRIRERALMKEGGGLASRFKDTTPAAKLSQEPVTCDVGADWEHD